MTEDSDDDDRMERADRIRRMREGRRSRGSTNGAAETEAAEEPADDDEAESTATDAAPDDEATADTGADESAASAPDDGESTDAVTASTAGPTVDGTTDPEPDTEASTADETSSTAAAETADDAGGFEFAQSNGDGERAAGAPDPDESGLAVETTADAEALEEKVAALSEAQGGIAESVPDGDAERAVSGLGNSTFAIPDQATTVDEDDDALDVEGTVAAARAAAAAGRRTAAAQDRTRVLEFDLGDERFCLDIDYVEEIVELENMTRVPNSPSYVEGVVDLRGQVTAIINPKDALDVGNEGRGELIIVFDSEQMDEQGHLGWVVDEVRQVTPVSEDEVNESPDEDAEHINGVINREDEDDFVVWTTPELALNSS